MTDIKIN